MVPLIHKCITYKTYQASMLPPSHELVSINDVLFIHSNIHVSWALNYQSSLSRKLVVMIPKTTNDRQHRSEHVLINLTKRKLNFLEDPLQNARNDHINAYFRKGWLYNNDLIQICYCCYWNENEILLVTDLGQFSNSLIQKR